MNFLTGMDCRVGMIKPHLVRYGYGWMCRYGVFSGYAIAPKVAFDNCVEQASQRIEIRSDYRGRHGGWTTREIA